MCHTCVTLKYSDTISDMKFKNFKLSSFMFILVLLFLFIDIVGYFLLRDNLADLKSKEELVLIYKVQQKMNFILNKLLYTYETKHELIKHKHQEAYDYLKTHDYDGDLQALKAQLNQDQDRPYFNISITDDQLVTRNTTVYQDQDFDMKFAEPLFLQHKAEGVIGISTPLLESVTQSFFTFTDQYLPRGGYKRILQVSYHYEGVDAEIGTIYKLIHDNPSVQYIQAYIIDESGEGFDFVFDPDTRKKPSLKGVDELKDRINRASQLEQKLGAQNWSSREFIHDDIHYKEVLVAQKSPISDAAKLIYAVVFDRSAYYDALQKLNIVMALLSLFSLLAIFLLNHLKKKEVLLHDQELFLRHAIHEIKTPLSVISLNNEMREKEMGKDEYSHQIDSAVKMLNISYNDLAFLIAKDGYSYTPTTLNLAKVVQERYAYFAPIATAQGKEIVATIKSDIQVEISKVELIRLIDNNLSNAIKYAHLHSTIELTLEENTLSFTTKSPAIQNSTKVFKKYYRENNVKGGYGIGLSIVGDIANKYAVEIVLESDDERTRFSYQFTPKEQL